MPCDCGVGEFDGAEHPATCSLSRSFAWVSWLDGWRQVGEAHAEMSTMGLRTEAQWLAYRAACFPAEQELMRKQLEAAIAADRTDVGT